MSSELGKVLRQQEVGLQGREVTKFRHFGDRLQQLRCSILEAHASELKLGKNYIPEWSKKKCYETLFCHQPGLSTKKKKWHTFQKKIRAATFGNIYHVTTPGTLLKKKVLLDNNYFIENVRTADDLEWRQRLIKKNYLIIFPNKYYLEYKALPKSYYALIKRYFI